MASEKTYLHNIHQVAVAMDEAPFSRHACAMAGRLSVLASAELTVVHAVPRLASYVDEVLFPYAAMGADRPGFEAELLEGAKNRIMGHATQALKDVDRFKNDHLYAQFLLGPRVQTTHAAVQNTNADLVLCGAFGDQPPTPGHLGSTTRGLIASARRPMLVVKEPKGAIDIKRVLIAIDGSRSSSMLMNWGISLALHYGAEVELVTVLPDPKRGDRANVLSGLHLPKGWEKKAQQEASNARVRALEELYVPFPKQKAFSELTLTHHVPTGDPSDEIVRVAREGEFDLVVLGARHPENPYQGQYGRTADAVARQTSSHVLLIPGHELVAPEQTPK